MYPLDVFNFEASLLPSDHMISSRPLIGSASFPTSPFDGNSSGGSGNGGGIKKCIGAIGKKLNNQQVCQKFGNFLRKNHKQVVKIVKQMAKLAEIAINSKKFSINFT